MRCVNAIYIPNDKEEQFYTLRLIKADCCDESLRLEGAVFDLYKKENNRCGYSPVLKGLHTDKNGEVFIENLSAGRYKLLERQAPASYVICNKSGWIFDINPCVADDMMNVDMMIYNCRDGCFFYM